MNWTEEERKIAGQLLDNKDTMAFLKKLYCPVRSSTRLEIESVIAMPDDVYGQQMKALVIAEKHFATQHSNIKRIAIKEKTEDTPLRNIAPK